MDIRFLIDVGQQLSKLPLYPYFEIAHFLLTCICVKDDIPDSHSFSRKHPLACWVSCMLPIFGGQMCANFLLGEPIISSFNNTPSLLLATLAWYIVFYLPLDIGYKLFNFLPVRLALTVPKEMLRCRKVYDGVTSASKIYPNSYIIMIIIGTLRGNGSAFIKIFERLFRGVWTPSAIELMKMSFTTKASTAASVLFVIGVTTKMSLNIYLIQLGVTVFFICCKLSDMLLGIKDPFIPIENILCILFFGGVWDSLQQLVTPISKIDQSASKNDSDKSDKSKYLKKKN